MSLSLTGFLPGRSLTARLDLAAAAFAIALGSAVFAAVLWVPAVLADPDTLWHITVGQWILANLAVPSTDIYSFTAQGRPWVAHEWLSEVVLTLAYRAGGWNGVIMLTAAAAGSATAVIALYVRRCLRRDIALMAVMLAVACGGGSLLARPHMIALPFAALWTAGVVGARARNAAPSFALLPVMVLWANLHGGFLVGLVVAAALALEAVMDPTCDRRDQLRKWVPFMAGAVVAAVLTPQGFSGLIYPLRLMSMKTLYEIQEWMPSDLGHLTGLSGFILVAIYLGLSGQWGLPKYRVAMMTGLLFTAMQHSRNGLVFAVVVPMLMADILGRIKTAPLPAKFLRIERMAGMAVVLAAFVSLSVRAAVTLDRGNEGYYATAALAHVPAELRARPVLNEYGFGGMLIFSGVKAFIDGRADLYGDEGIGEYLAITQGQGNALDKALCKYDIAWTIFPPNTVVPALMDRTPGWHRLYSDKVAVVHVRDADDKPANCKDHVWQVPAG